MASLYKKPITQTDPKTGQRVKAKSKKWWGRYRDASGKPRLVHTLNGSGVALPRLMIALLEQCQQADGSVLLPPAIRPYLRGLERLQPVTAAG